MTRRTSMARTFSSAVSGTGLTILLSLSAPAVGQQLDLLAGRQHTQSLNEDSYAYSFEYLHNLGEHLFATFTWLNEGHVADHHRDGYAPQVWGRWLAGGRRLSLSAGLGAYRYYDTTNDASGNTINEHGWGVIYSGAAHWYFSGPWVLELRYNHTHTPRSIDTNMVMAGFGYQFDPISRPGPQVPSAVYGFASSERNAATVMLGKSIINDFQSSEGAAWGVEYRRRLTPYIDVTGAWLDEGDTDVIQRHGLAAQLWMAREFLSHRASVGLGAGTYIAREHSEAGSSTEVLGLLGMTLSYGWAARWNTRLYWYRTVSSNNRDTDILFVGAGYAF